MCAFFLMMWLLGHELAGKAKVKINRKVYQEKIEVVFEDEHMAILNKPGGLPVNGNLI